MLELTPLPDALFGLRSWGIGPSASATSPALSAQCLCSAAQALMARTLGGLLGEAWLSRAAIQIQGRVAQPLPSMFTWLGEADTPLRAKTWCGRECSDFPANHSC